MKTEELVAMIGIDAESRSNERERCLKAVDAEPELPGSMPDEMWYAICSDRKAATEAMRIIVRQTKQGIRDRIIGYDVNEAPK